MGAQTKKQTPHTPTLQMVPPPPADHPLEDDASPIGPQIVFEEASTAFDWLESVADLINVAVTSVNNLDDETIENAAWLMKEIAEGGRAALEREQEKAGREGR